MTDHYPGYKKVSDTEGKIGDVTVKWTITPSDDNAYQNALDEALKKQDSAAADDKIDLFLVEADYALKYVDTDYTLLRKYSRQMILRRFRSCSKIGILSKQHLRS